MARARSPFHVDSTRSEISIRARPGFAESVFFYVHAVFTMVIGAIALAPLLMRTPGAPLAPNLPLIVFGVAFYFVFVAILGLSLWGTFFRLFGEEHISIRGDDLVVKAKPLPFFRRTIPLQALSDIRFVPRVVPRSSRTNRVVLSCPKEEKVLWSHLADSDAQRLVEEMRTLCAARGWRPHVKGE